MTFNMNKNGTELTVTVEGRLDTITTPKLEAALENKLEDITLLVFDFAKLDYISSAGLRVLLTAMQAVEDNGKMVLRNVNEDVMNIFEVTGFVDDLNIE